MGCWWHTHTADVWIVGIKGAYLYKDEAGEKRVGPGDFFASRAGINTGAEATRKKAPSLYGKLWQVRSDPG